MPGRTPRKASSSAGRRPASRARSSSPRSPAATSWRSLASAATAGGPEPAGTPVAAGCAIAGGGNAGRPAETSTTRSTEDTFGMPVGLTRHEMVTRIPAGPPRRRASTPVPPFRRQVRTVAPSRTIDDPRVRRGMETQLGRWRAALAGGAARVGWKTGINSRAVQRSLGIDDVVLGYLTSGTALPAGAMHSLAGGTRVGMEAEIALHLGADLGSGATPEEARDAVAALGTA